jgi:superfamily II DNA or RNA helicase
MAQFEIGSLVRCRAREWVVLPSDQPDVLLLRPLGGVEAETCGIYLPVEGSLVESASFAPPDPAKAGDFVSGRLLHDAARLTLRSGAGPFRSLGHLGIRPRPYQLVPLIMALRLDPVRLLIADDVGIGKTIEAGLIARELLDRGEIRRLTVLCPPHLCDQWQRELQAKFAIDAVVVRSSTAAALERSLPRGDISIFEYYPFTVASIDYVKSDRRRDSFLRTRPDLVIVDEAHTATDASGSGNQQQRYDLVRELAAKAEGHLLLLTATPHSGIEDAFKSLLALLRPTFADLNMERLSEVERDDLARHFVQRRRADVQRWLGEDDVTPFPVRESAEVTYSLPRASEYRKLFNDVYAFTRELVREGTGAQRSWRQRARYWAALALLRCVMSSPAAAEKALRSRSDSTTADEADLDAAGSDDLFSGYVYDPTDQEGALDVEPSQVVEQGSPRGERDRLNRFATRAAALKGNADAKLLRLTSLLDELLRDGFNPIVYCRYIATANYVAEELGKRLKGASSDLRILAVTGERSEEERETLIAELERSPRRLLIATDCLSEGINLQQAFDAVIHYDLPWNPNRLEQREGRVDRYGQPSKKVRTVLLYGQDNPMDEAVMKVLLRKAASIHRTLGISVPLPLDSGTVVETLIASLFTPAPRQASMFDEFEQMTLLDADQGLERVEQAWNRAVEREKESRTRFAQRRIKPEEVARELEETDAVLGDPAAVERFVRAACERLNATLTIERGHLLLSTGPLPQPIQERIGSLLPQARKGRDVTMLPLTFGDTGPQGVERIGRNHPLTAALAEYLLESALTPEASTELAARCGLIRTSAVTKRTVLLLLRVRMLIKNRQETPNLAEELVVCGYTRSSGTVQWLDEAEALGLLQTASPATNITPDERVLGLQSALTQINSLTDELNAIAHSRAVRLRESHARVRTAVGSGQATVTPRTPPDVLGVYVLMPAL